MRRKLREVGEHRFNKDSVMIQEKFGIEVKGLQSPKDVQSLPTLSVSLTDMLGK